MANAIETVILKMAELGVFNLLIFMFALAAFYTLLKKTKIFGESPAIIGTIAFAIAFMVFGYPVIIGYSLVTPFVSMFAMATTVMLVVIMAVLMTGYFYPDMNKFLAERFKSRTPIYAGIIVATAIAILSGAVSVLWNQPTSSAGTPSAPVELIVMAGAVILLIIVLIIMSAMGSSKS
jgi:hypothetical protein